jgi:hypothetical protein
VVIPPLVDLHEVKGTFPCIRISTMRIGMIRWGCNALRPIIGFRRYLTFYQSLRVALSALMIRTANPSSEGRDFAMRTEIRFETTSLMECGMNNDT